VFYYSNDLIHFTDISRV